MTHDKRYRRSIRVGVGILLVLVGAAILILGFPAIEGPPQLQAELESVLNAGDPEFPDIPSFYPIRKIERFVISDSEGGRFALHMAHYGDKSEANYSAIFALPDPARSNLPFRRKGQSSFDAWLKAAETIRNSTDRDALFVTWWDNAQRIHWLAGRNSWTRSTAAEAFTTPDRRRLWKRLSGGFAPDGKALKDLGRWLTLDAEKALAEITARIGQPEIHFLVCVDDLARISEISALTGNSLPFETRLFSANGNIHGLIKQVKQWANEKGPGHYLVQQLATGTVRAWRITTKHGTKMLLARLLPFTSSLANPIHGLKTIYRSEEGGYLSVFSWKQKWSSS